MLILKAPVSLKKVLTLSTAILFTVNSISFAQHLSKNALRAESSALSVSSEILSSLQITQGPLLDNEIIQAKFYSSGIKKSAKPSLDDEGLLNNMQNTREHLDVLSAKSAKAWSAVMKSSKYDPALWDILWKTDKDYRDAVEKLVKHKDTTSFIKTSSSGMLGNLVDKMHRAVTEFIDTESHKIGLTALNQFKSKMEGIASDFKQYSRYSIYPDSALFNFIKIVESVEWVFEESKDAASASKDFDKIMADKFVDIKPSATIIIDQNDIPRDQRMLVWLIAKSNSRRNEIIERFGMNIVLANQFDPLQDRVEHMVIISKSRIKIEGAEKAHYLNLQSEINDEEAFIQLSSAIVFAKGLILFSITNSLDIETALAFFYKRLTSGKRPWSREMLYNFLKPSGQFTLSLPKARPVDKDYFDTLQKVSLQVFIAA